MLIRYMFIELSIYEKVDYPDVDIDRVHLSYSYNEIYILDVAIP